MGNRVGLGNDLYLWVLFVLQIYSGLTYMSENKNTGEKQNETEYESGEIPNDVLIKITQQSQLTNSSEFTQSLYNPMMSTASSLTITQIIRKLKNYGIEYNSNQFYDTFTKIYTKTDLESMIYQVRFGRFRTSLKVIYVKLDSNLLCTNSIDKGSYGDILKFSLQPDQVYALKNISFNNNSQSQLDFVLREVMMAKIMSALQVGPKFTPIFAYDAIIYQNKIQFAMELCRTNYTQLQILQQIQHKSLLNLLKTIHSIGICHVDIKKQNIGWSQTYNKFIFLDFSFTLSIANQIGEKTMTGFVGTYNYASPEMKKLFWLGINGKVDLYYNDLNCLQRVWKVLSQSKDTALPKLDKKSSDMQIRDQNQSIVRYYSIKMHIFMQNYTYALYEMVNDEILINTFRKIIFSLEQFKQIRIRYNDLPIGVDSCLEEKKWNFIDLILFNYETQKIDNNLVDEKIGTFFQLSKSETFFRKTWKEDSWKEKIFFSIDVYSNFGQDKYQARKMLIKRIHKQITKQNPKQFSQETSNLMMFRSVLLFYFQFFKQKKNIIVLQKILTYFVLMQDQLSREKVEQFILDCWWNQDDKQREYYCENFKYFVGKIAISQDYVDYTIGNVKNMKKLRDRLLNKSSPDSEFVELINSTLLHMQLLEKLKYVSQVEQYKKLSQQIRRTFPKKQLPAYLQTFQQSIINQFQNSHQHQFENIYIQKCWFLANILFFVKIEQNPKKRLQSFIDTECFLKQFETFTNLAILQYEDSRYRTRILKLSQDYMEISKDIVPYHNQKFFMFYLKYLRKEDIFQYSIRVIRDFDMAVVRNLEDTYLLLGMVFFILFNLFRNQQLRPNLPTPQNLTQIQNIILPFLEYTNNPDPLYHIKTLSIPYQPQYQLHNRVPSSKNFTKEYKNRIRIIKLYCYLLANREHQVMDEIIQYLVRDGEVQEANQMDMAVSCGLCFGGRAADDGVKEVFRDLVLVKNQTVLDKKFFYVYSQFPELMSLVLNTYNQKKHHQKLYTCLCQAVHHIHQQQQYKNVLSIEYQKILLFIRNCELSQLYFIIEESMKKSLEEISEFYGLSYLLQLVQDCVRKFQGKLDGKVRRRLMIIGVYFADRFSSVCFKPYKQYLQNQVHSTKCKKCKKLKHKRKLAISQSDLSSAQDFQFLNIYRHRSWLSERKKTIHSKIISRTKIYFYNAQEQSMWPLA